jgi:SAM-dependent methyltransferase
MGAERFLEDSAVEGLGDRLAGVMRRFDSGLMIGSEVPGPLQSFADRWTMARFDAGEALAVDAGPYDLAVSLFSLQAINDLPGALVQIRRALKPDGLFLGGLLQRAGFALPVADVERLVVRYGEFGNLVRDLRAHGQTNVLSERRKQFLRRDVLAAVVAHYRAHHAQDGKLNARFEMVYLTGWAPDQSQQQPLKPGSASARLAEALGTVERKL